MRLCLESTCQSLGHLFLSLYPSSSRSIIVELNEMKIVCELHDKKWVQGDGGNLSKEFECKLRIPMFTSEYSLQRSATYLFERAVSEIMVLQLNQGP